MKQFNKLRRAYFIGIGGIGMSALARHFNSRGVQVFGYDKVPTVLTKQLEKEGMKINYQDNPALIPKKKIDLVVYTPAIPKEHRQLCYFIEKKIPVRKRAEVLQALTRGCFTIAVSGSHGKTSVTTMVAHILKDTGYDCTAFLGGISLNYHSNYISGSNDVVVVEADEFDRSFLRLSPSIAVITAVDTDHLDIYGSLRKIEEAFMDFAGKVKKEGVVIAQSKVSILGRLKNQKLITYSFSDASADYYVTNSTLKKDISVFDISGKDGIAGVSLQIGGRHNIENALAAYSVARQLGIEKNRIKKAISTFKGVKRRFEHIIRNPELVFIDDYAHHPAEISALLEAVRTIYPGRKITAVFQPHLYSRTRDLHTEFAASLDKADEVIILDIYPAREKPLPTVNSEMIARCMKSPHRQVVQKEKLLPVLKTMKPEVLLTIGAGDIDTLVEPIKRMFLKQTS